MAELALDVVEDILVRLDVEDLIRCKSVCKSWYSFISCSRFVKAHLNHAYNNDPELGGHRRIALSSILSIDNNCVLNGTHIVGSCNGLVCVSPLDFELLVTNPLTREEKKLPTPPFRPNLGKFALMREIVCWGFGYDFSTDDYKVIAGFRETPSRKLTVFYALTLKSNLWQVIGEVKYRCIDGFNGVLCGGALHWFMSDKYKRVIISLDLSTQEFKEIPQPADEEYVNDVVNDVDDIECFLGVIEEYLCIYWDRSPLSSKTWVMKNNTWELYNNDHCETKYDVSHSLLLLPKRNSSNAYALGDGKCVPSAGPYVRASIFVKSLVSPHPHSKNYEGQKRNMNKGWEGNASVISGAKGNKRKNKRRKRMNKKKKEKMKEKERYEKQMNYCEQTIEKAISVVKESMVWSRKKPTMQSFLKQEVSQKAAVGSKKRKWECSSKQEAVGPKKRKW